MIVDVSVNLRGHVSLPFYQKRHSAAKERGSTAWTAETLIAALDEAGIVMAGVIASVAAHGVGGQEDSIHVDEVKPLLDAAPDRLFGWVGVNPLKRMETVRYIDYAVRELGFKGVHCYPHWFGARVDEPIYYPIYAKCAELGVPITLQVGAQSGRSGARLAARPSWLDSVAADFPELTLIGLHIGSPWVEEMIMLCKSYENVYIIADGHRPSTWEPELIEYMHGGGRYALDGPSRVMWGTDWPIQTFKESLEEVDALGLRDDVRERLLGGNAKEVFGL